VARERGARPAPAPQSAGVSTLTVPGGVASTG
jgi:hypothetical protein